MGLLCVSGVHHDWLDFAKCKFAGVDGRVVVRVVGPAVANLWAVDAKVESDSRCASASSCADTGENDVDGPQRFAADDGLERDGLMIKLFEIIPTDILFEKKTLTQRVRSSLVRERGDLGQSVWRMMVRFWKFISDTDQWRSEDGALMSIDRVEGGQSRTGAWQVSFPDRGCYDIGPAKLSSTSPVGLQACHLYLDEVRQCYVAPALGVLNQGWVKRLKSMSPGSGTGMRRRGMDQEEFYALRPWRSGDSRKHIHWRTTARYGLPIVRQFDQNDDRDVAIVLDLYCPALDVGCEKQKIEKFLNDAEMALSFATTVLSRAKVDVRGRITLGICGQRKHFFPGRQADFLASAMKSLSVAQPGPRPPTIETLLDVTKVDLAQYTHPRAEYSA